MTSRSTGDGHVGRKRPREQTYQGKVGSAHTSKASNSHPAKKPRKASPSEKQPRKYFSSPGNIQPATESVVLFTGKSVTGGEPLSERSLSSHGKNIIQFDPGISEKDHRTGITELETLKIDKDWITVELGEFQESKEPLDLFWQRVWKHFLITDESRQRVLRDFIFFAIEIENIKTKIPTNELDYWMHMIREEAQAIIEVIVNDEQYWSQDIQNRTILLGILRRIESDDFKVDASSVRKLGIVMNQECEHADVLRKTLNAGRYTDLIEATKAYRINGSDWMDLESEWFAHYLTSIESKSQKLKNYLIFLAEGYQHGYCIDDTKLLDRLIYVLDELNPDIVMLKEIKEPIMFLNHVLLLRRATWQEKEQWCNAIEKLYHFALSIANVQF